MDRGEPALVPQWLKNNGSTSNGGGLRQPHSFSSSSRRSDDHSLVKHTRSVSSANTGVNASERTTSAYFHRNSGSRGSARLQSYGSFGSRGNRNGVYEDPVKLNEKDKLGVGVNRSTNHSDYLGSGLQLKFEKDELQRSKSVNGRRDEGAPRRNNSSELCDKYHSSRIFLPSSGNGFAKINKPSFEYDFPSLVSEDHIVAPEIGRVRSPGFRRQLSPTSDGWTSVLAEAPGTNGTGRSSMLHSSQIPSDVPTPLPRSMVPPNMAEAVAQIPVRARTPPELSANIQRLEELAIKKSKQLIPMTPNTPRPHITSSLDKSRTRIVQPQVKPSPSPSPSISGSQPLRVGTSQLDAVKSSNLGKLQILKPSKDLNGVYSAGKERLGTANGVSVSTSPLREAPPTDGSPAVNSLSHQRLARLEHKPAVVSTNLEKKPSLQAQSRIEFFNCLKQKSSSGNSAACNGDHSLSSTLTERSDPSSTIPITPEMKQEAPSSAPALDRGIENGMVATSTYDGDDCILTRHPTVNGEEQLFPLNEEDAAFMRSLGWEESPGEDEEGLTEEEINSFLQERANMGLSSQSLSVQKMALQLKAGLNNCLGFSGARARSWSMPRSES